MQVHRHADGKARCAACPHCPPPAARAHGRTDVAHADRNGFIIAIRTAAGQDSTLYFHTGPLSSQKRAILPAVERRLAYNYLHFRRRQKASENEERKRRGFPAPLRLQKAAHVPLLGKHLTMYRNGAPDSAFLRPAVLETETTRKNNDILCRNARHDRAVWQAAISGNAAL